MVGVVVEAQFEEEELQSSSGLVVFAPGHARYHGLFGLVLVLLGIVEGGIVVAVDHEVAGAGMVSWPLLGH